MAVPPRSQQELLEASHHVGYEVGMLRHTAPRLNLRSHRPRKTEATGHLAANPLMTMTKLLIFDEREGSDNVLLKLSTVLSRLPLAHVDAWLVSGLEAMGAMPFLSLGVPITTEELSAFQSDDVEILEGQFRGLSFHRSTGSTCLDDFTVVVLTLFDSTFWECETNDPGIIAAIRRNFSDVREPAQMLASYVQDKVAQLSGPNAEDAWHSLVEAGSAALPYVVEAFDAANDDQIKVSLVEVVGQYRLAAGVPFLTVSLRHRNAHIWKAALDGLVMLGGQPALDALTLARATAPPDQRDWITEAVQQIIEGRGPD